MESFLSSNALPKKILHRGTQVVMVDNLRTDINNNGRISTKQRDSNEGKNNNTLVPQEQINLIFESRGQPLNIRFKGAWAWS